MLENGRAAFGGARRRQDLENHLSLVPGVDDCVVLERAESAGRQPTVAYVVPRPGADLRAVRRRLGAAALGLGDVVAVMVTRIPRDRDGGPRIDALTAIPALTTARVRQQLSATGRLSGIPLKVELRGVEARPARRAFGDRDRTVPPVPPVRPVPRGRDAAPVEGWTAAIAGRPPAAADGGPLLPRPGDPRTITEALLSAPERGVTVEIVSGHGQVLLTAEVLLQRARHILGGLRELGLSPGSAVVLQISDLGDHFATLWACLLGGLRSVTVAAPPAGYSEPSGVLDKLVDVWRDLGGPPIVTDDARRADLAAAGRLYGDEPLPVASVALLLNAAPVQEVHRPDPADVALLQLTSGSTGRPKIVQITHRAVTEMALAARARDLIQPGDITYNWLPMDHVVPAVMFHLRNVVLGCRGVHSPTAYVLEQPLRWLDVLQSHRVNHSWAPNFGYKLVTDALLASPGARWDLSSVKTLVDAGEQCTAPVVRAFTSRLRESHLPDDALLCCWGMAETSTCITYKRWSDAGSVRRVLKSSLSAVLEPADAATPDSECTEFLSTGRADPGSRFRIVDADGKPLPELVIGRLQAASARVTPGYLDNPTANAEVFTADGWFDTGDLAFVVEGEVVITGRTKEQIVVNGVNHYCFEIEDTCGVVDGVRNGLVAACGMPDEQTGTESLAVFYVPEPAGALDRPEELAAIAARIRSALARAGQLPPRHIVPLTRAEFPRTTSGKIQRRHLAEALLAGEFGERLDAATSGTPLPDCLFRPGWQAREALRPEPPDPAAVTVVFADEAGVADRLDLPGRTIRIRRGDGFAVDDAGISIDPGSPSDWSRLGETLTAWGPPPGLVVYLWSYLPTPDPAGPLDAVREAEERCGEHLLACVRTLVARDEPVAGLVTVSRGLHRVTGSEDPCYPAALASGIGAVVAAESPAVRTWHVDLPGQDAATEAGALTALLAGRQSLPPVTAWRNDRPYVPCLDPVPEVGEPRDALERGRWYLVAGGDGGIGRRLLPELAGRYGVRFLVIGRNVGPGTAQVRTEVADVGDRDAVRAAVARAEADWQSAPGGALHLADVYRLRLLADETPETWREGLRAKCRGTVNLASVVRERGGRLVIFSSLLGLAGSAGCGAYVAGTRYAEAFAEHLRATTGIDVHCLAWGLWRETGLNRDNPYAEAVRRRGILSLAPAEAAVLTRVALRQPSGNLLVGVDSGAAPMRALVRSAERLELERPVLVVPEGTSADGPLSVVDPFGVVAEVDTATDARARPAGDREAAFALQIEEVMSTVATAALNRQVPFHELGLGSIQVLQVHARLEARLGYRIPSTALYEHPTIDSLVTYLAAI